MNALNLFVEKLSKAFNEKVGGDSPAPIIKVVDSVYFRTFELKDLYEFQEEEDIESGSVGFDVTIQIHRNIVLEFRLVSCPTDSLIGLVRIRQCMAEVAEVVLPFIETVAKSVNLKTLIATGVKRSTIQNGIVAAGWKAIGSHSNGVDTLYCYSKTVQ